MNNVNTLPITDARKNIYKISDAVQVPGTFFTLTDKGRPKAVIMSAEDFDSWQETLQILEQFPHLAKDVAKVDQAIHSSNFDQYPTFEEVMLENGFVAVADSHSADQKLRFKNIKSNKHEMDNSIRKTSTKRAQ